MKRYRVLVFDFDSGPTLLTMEIREDWKEDVKKQHQQNQENLKRELLKKFGSDPTGMKLKNYIDLGPKHMAILAFHNKFFEQIRNTFTVGSYYPALTGACALGERILNHLILTLREDFRSTPQYKKVYQKDSFDDWKEAITTLESWEILLPEVAKSFYELKELRNRTLHFNPVVDTNDRNLALEATISLGNILYRQFGAFGNQPWFIPNIPGASYIKKELEREPFIKRIYLPNCSLVGPKHSIEFVPKKEGLLTEARDDNIYEDREISDEEFRDLLLNKKE